MSSIKLPEPRPSLTACRHQFAHGDKRLPFCLRAAPGRRRALWSSPAHTCCDS